MPQKPLPLFSLRKAAHSLGQSVQIYSFNFISPYIPQKRCTDSYNALVAQNADGEPAEQVERELLDFLKQFKVETVYLAGNSIHQDRKFIEREWPELNKKLHYRMLDVSAWKVYFENALHRQFAKPENHRALDDIRGSIEELKWYLKMIS